MAEKLVSTCLQGYAITEMERALRSPSRQTPVHLAPLGFLGAFCGVTIRTPISKMRPGDQLCQLCSKSRRPLAKNGSTPNTSPRRDWKMQAPMRLGSCVRCHGDLVLEDDRTGDYWRCFQCGREYPVVVPDPLPLIHGHQPGHSRLSPTNTR